ncbi:hypothetical protein MIB92_10340 [Aestuariirhabdus sp. Z084]|uniref:hypothetical protein n=1 Tax=Aestuariirhabdus haliotis TaxID=2918751 RepID=UPI00201B3663|nr:hypothetical protein [Aestuariirhabdus haliotis]MCL6416052.1 hypothetical protein [Aestuariirhabdus haliotis]MCL6419380.1 hypothetical protein [Aestuariirhabdus haliotis]
MKGPSPLLDHAIQVMVELGWDDELAATGDTWKTGATRATFAVENSMIDEFKHDFQATQEELTSNPPEA